MVFCLKPAPSQETQEATALGYCTKEEHKGQPSWAANAVNHQLHSPSDLLHSGWYQQDFENCLSCRWIRHISSSGQNFAFCICHLHPRTKQPRGGMGSALLAGRKTEHNTVMRTRPKNPPLGIDSKPSIQTSTRLGPIAKLREFKGEAQWVEHQPTAPPPSPLMLFPNIRSQSQAPFWKKSPLPVLLAN